jgi:hypothetical protein
MLLIASLLWSLIAASSRSMEIAILKGATVVWVIVSLSFFYSQFSVSVQGLAIASDQPRTLSVVPTRLPEGGRRPLGITRAPSLG